MIYAMEGTGSSDMAFKQFCKTYRDLKHLIGPLWVADLMDNFNATSPWALTKIFDGERVTPNHCRWQKIFNGALPDDRRILRVKQQAPNGDRVLALPLWKLLKLPLLLTDKEFERQRDSTLNEVLQGLAPPSLRSLIYDEGLKQRWPVDPSLILYPLSRHGTVDALTALLAMLIELRSRWTQSNSIETIYEVNRHTYRTFLRLATFPPFYSVWPTLYEYLDKYVLRMQLGREYYIAGVNTADVSHTPDEARELLVALWGLRLVGPTFDDQIQFVHAYFEFMEEREAFKAILRINDDIRRTRRAVTIPRTDPIFALLKRLRHPSTDSNQALVLPLGNSEPQGDVRIANALGPMAKISG